MNVDTHLEIGHVLRLSPYKPMRSMIVFALLILAYSSATNGQSGRKVQTPATPAVVSTVEDGPEYSETKPTTGPTYSQLKGRKSARPAGSVAPKSDDRVNESIGDDEIIKVETSLVTIPVSVFERSGVYISGLRRNDFTIFENGKVQEIAYFGTTEQPFSVVLVIDTSPSTEFKIEDIQRAALAFVDLLSPADRVMVVEFNSGVDTHTDFTNDRQKIERAIRKTSFGYGTALYNAVESVLRKKLALISGRKAIVLFTDGVDTVSRESKFIDTLAMAEEGEAVIFPVYYNTYLQMRGIGTGGAMQVPPTIGLPTGNAPNSADYARGRSYLEELARVTGGRMFRAESTTGGLNAAFAGIAEEMRSQYSIGYYPQEPGELGQRRQIKVRVARPNVAVRARDHYIVGAMNEQKKAAN